MEIKGLYRLQRKDEETLIQTYLDAFQRYPKLIHAFPEKKAKDAALEATLRYYVAYDLEYGDAFSLAENVTEGVCLVHSEDMHYTRERHEKAGSFSPAYRAAMDRLTEEEQKRREDLFEELDRLEAGITFPRPHLYLDFLGVREAFQHKGRGRRLMEQVCRYAGEQNLPMMLFTNTPEDVEFYKSLGFQTVAVVKSEEFGFINTYLVKEV